MSRATGADPRPLRSAWLRRLALLLIGAAVVAALVRAVDRIDTGQVIEALSRLPWWGPFPLLALLLLRQVLNAAPLAVYIPAASLYRCTVNDLAAGTTTAFAPAPSDVVVRVAMFRSWGIRADLALAGATMNAVTFFIVRFSAPLLGFALLPFLQVPPGLRLIDLASLLVAAVLLGGVLLVTRGEESAARTGHLAGRLARTVRSGTDPEGWSRTLREFQQHLAADFPQRFPRALLLSYAVLLADLAIFSTALRLMGVDAAAVPFVDIAAAHLFAFPLTMFPAQGLGIMDSAMMASLTETAGAQILEPALAAALVWRAFIVAGPFVLGAAALLLWRRGTARADRPGAAAGS